MGIGRREENGKRGKEKRKGWKRKGSKVRGREKGQRRDKRGTECQKTKGKRGRRV